jgi:Flp pilus assembly protein TadD
MTKIVVIVNLLAAGGCSTLPGTSDAGTSLVNTLSDIKTWSGKVADNLLRGGSVTTVSDRPSGGASSADDIIRQADALRGTGDLASAAWYYARATLVDPKSLNAQLRLGETELALQNDAAAFVAYRAAQGLAPAHHEVALRLGEILLTRGDAPAALDQFTIALRSGQDDPKLFNVVGVALTLEGNYKFARQNFERGLRLKPDYPGLLNNLGLMELREGDLPRALEIFSALIASHPTERYAANRALVELALGQTDAALKDAPGVNEGTLRQTLARYNPDNASTASGIVHLERSFNSLASGTQTTAERNQSGRSPPQLSEPSQTSLNIDDQSGGLRLSQRQ